jgi:lipid-A-disaccharide synthase-like uncharacterized protein
MSRLREEMKVIPSGAWSAALLLCAVLPVGLCVYWIINGYPSGPSAISRHAPELIVGCLAFAFFSVYILIIGYIVGDARRRGMPVLLWTLLAIFIPSAIGIILYFILRRPLLRACSQCGTRADAAYAFCPSCGATLGKTCPSCHNSVEYAWAHCAKCGAALQTA